MPLYSVQHKLRVDYNATVKEIIKRNLTKLKGLIMDFVLQLVQQFTAERGTSELICAVAENLSSMHYSREVFLKTYEHRLQTRDHITSDF